MDFHGNHQPESGKLEQILSQFLLKSLHIILDSRIPSLRSRDRSGDLSLPTRVRKSDKWFNLILGDRPATLENLNFWHRNVLDPMIIDIILVHEAGSSPSLRSSAETVIERWIVQYELPRGVLPQSGERIQSYKRTYKKAILLLRSLYSQMRLLPAYRIFRQLCSVSQSYNFDLIYRVSSFCHPSTNEEKLQEYSFLPIEAPPGRISMSVLYYPSFADFKLEALSTFPPKIITDYVGSPTTDPLRSFPLSEKGVRATSFPTRGIGNQCSSSPSHRPHSWTSGFQRPGSRDSFSPPADRIQCSQQSPPFSPSMSPSAPKHVPNVRYVHNRGMSDTAPVSIPLPLSGRTSRYLSPNFSDLNRSSLPPLSPRSTRHDSSSQESPSSIRSIRKSDGTIPSDLNSGQTNPIHKALRDSREDSGRFSGLLSSSGSPRIGFSRSSSRLSLQDDIDECDFSCPFIVDDVDISDVNASARTSGSVNESPETASAMKGQMGKKSQDAAVGILVHMLRTAPPLRQESSCSLMHSIRTVGDGAVATVSGFYVPRKTSDALEELRGYRELKDLLLSRSGTRPIDKEED